MGLHDFPITLLHKATRNCSHGGAHFTIFPLHFSTGPPRKLQPGALASRFPITLLHRAPRKLQPGALTSRFSHYTSPQGPQENCSQGALTSRFFHYTSPQGPQENCSQGR